MTNPLINTSCQFCKNDKTIHLHTITGMYDDPRKFNIVQCLVCSLIYINPRYSKQENFESYEEKYFTTNVVDPSGNNRCVINERESKIKAHKIDYKHLKNPRDSTKPASQGGKPVLFRADEPHQEIAHDN